MPSFNLVVLMGNLTKDPDLKYTSGGAAVCSFGLAVNRAYTDDSGEMHEDATFVNIVCWNRLAEVTAEYLHKGSPALIEGRLQQQSWETDNGTRRYKMEVVARSVQFLGGRQTEDDSDDSDSGDDVPF